MTLAPFVPSVSEAMQADIEHGLRRIEADHGVNILMAVESGSRAWGFPSPDSDYDVRFVYAHPVDWYLSIRPGRDVIELPIDDDLDINGWDLRKALGLLVKPNPVLLEWLSSPIRYVWDEDVCNRLTAFARLTAHRLPCLHHYRNLARDQWRRHVGDGRDVNLKKYFYVLRPALALRWIRLHPDVFPPMNLQALIDGIDLNGATVDAIAALLVQKSASRELGSGSRIAPIDTLIEEELALASEATPHEDRQDLTGEVDDLFRDIVKAVTRSFTHARC